MKRYRPEGLVQNALALMVSGAGSAAIGIVFWGVAAHLVSPAIIGRMSTEITAVVLLSLVSQLSFATNFERFLPIAANRTRSFVARSYAICAVVSLVLATAYVLLGVGHRFLGAGLVWKTFFIASVPLWTIFVLQDSVLVGLRATRWVPVENILYAMVKLPILPALLALSASQGVFTSSMMPVVVVIIVVNWYLFRVRIPRHMTLNPGKGDLPSVRELMVLAGGEYGAQIIAILTFSVTTLVVLDRLGPVANAHYYIPSQISGGGLLVLISIMRSFVVEASTEPERLAHFARLTLKTMVCVLLPVVVIGIAVAPELLRVFGQSYANQGTTLLRMLLLSLPSVGVTVFYFSFALLDKRIWWTAIRQIVSAVIFFVMLFLLLNHFKILAVGIASLIESGLLALFFLPILIRRYRLAVRPLASESGAESR